MKRLRIDEMMMTTTTTTAKTHNNHNQTGADGGCVTRSSTNEFDDCMELLNEAEKKVQLQGGCDRSKTSKTGATDINNCFATSSAFLTFSADSTSDPRGVRYGNKSPSKFDSLGNLNQIILFYFLFEYLNI